MKYLKIIVTVLVLSLFLVTLSGCGAKVDIKNIEENGNKTIEDKKVTTNTESGNINTETKDIVTELYNKSTQKGSIVCQYRFPKININSLYAKESNIEIEDQVKLANKTINFVNNSKEDILPDYYLRTDYKYFINSNILSVIVYGSYDWGGAEIIGLYNIDIKTGTRLEKTDLLKTTNITENDFQEKVFNIVSNKDEFYQFETHLLTKKELCTLERCKIFYSNSGHVWVAVPVEGTDITGYYYLNLNTSEVIKYIKDI